MRFNSITSCVPCLSVCLSVSGLFVLTHNDQSGQKAEQDAVCNPDNTKRVQLFSNFQQHSCDKFIAASLHGQVGEIERKVRVCVSECAMQAHVSTFARVCVSDPGDTHRVRRTDERPPAHANYTATAY